MNALPILIRELRLEARRPQNYWVRMGAGAIVTASFALTALSHRMARLTGDELFNQASLVMLSLVWVGVPLLTADCLSREKREGTLGLLFLTPLTAAGIVVGKSLVHALRAMSFLMAAMPVLAIGLLIGGVSGTRIVAMLVHLLSALALALSGGLIASACTRQWLRSVVVSACLTFLLGVSYYRAFSQVRTLRGAIWLFVFALAFLAAAIVLAAHRIRVSLLNDAPSRLTVWWLRTFCSPRFWRTFFQRSLRQSLDRNPIGWLQHFSTSARVAKWVWGMGATFAVSLLIDVSNLGFQWFVGFEIALALGMTFAGAASFRRERQNGVMELIVVSPLHVNEIIRGRLRGLRVQFLPSILIILLPLGIVAFGIAPLIRGDLASFIFAHGLLLGSSFVTLPELGLYFSLRLRRFFPAWAGAVAVGLIVPYILAATLTSPNPLNASVWGVAALVQFTAGRMAIAFLRDGLNRSALALPNA